MRKTLVHFSMFALLVALMVPAVACQKKADEATDQMQSTDQTQGAEANGDQMQEGTEATGDQTQGTEANGDQMQEGTEANGDQTQKSDDSGNASSDNMQDDNSGQ